MTEDRKISERYRELGAETPSRHVDEAILAASRRAVHVRPAPLVPPTGRRRWYFPVAAAAVIVLAAGVALHVERDQPDPGSSGALMKQQAPQPQARADVVARQGQEMRAAKEKKLTEAPARAPAPAPAPAPTPEAEAKAFAYSREARPEVKQEQQAQDRVIAQGRRLGAASGAAVQTEQLENQPPEKWIEVITGLRRKGSHEQADKLLEEFRKRYPDYKIPESALRLPK